MSKRFDGSDFSLYRLGLESFVKYVDLSANHLFGKCVVCIFRELPKIDPVSLNGFFIQSFSGHAVVKKSFYLQV